MFGEIKKLHIERVIEEKKVKQPFRKYLGVSQLGHPCTRYLFYKFRFYLPESIITPREERLFQRGHREEEIILSDLKKAGVIVVSTQQEVSYCHGHIKGHSDAVLLNIIDAPKTEHLGEFKTSATKYFNALIASQSVKKSFPSHYDQMQGYMFLQKLTRALYICVNKEDDRRYYERVRIDTEWCEFLFSKAEHVIFSTCPPKRIGNSKYYRCGPNWCEFRNICHFNDTKSINRSCRNCTNVELHDKGRWFCNDKDKFLSFKKQKKGCKKWEILPDLNG